MRFVLGHAVRMLRDLVGYGARSGRWWMALVIPLLTVAAVAISVVKVAAPAVVYAFF